MSRYKGIYGISVMATQNCKWVQHDENYRQPSNTSHLTYYFCNNHVSLLLLHQLAQVWVQSSPTIRSEFTEFHLLSYNLEGPKQSSVYKILAESKNGGEVKVGQLTRQWYTNGNGQSSLVSERRKRQGRRTRTRKVISHYIHCWGRQIQGWPTLVVCRVDDARYVLEGGNEE